MLRETIKQGLLTNIKLVEFVFIQTCCYSLGFLATLWQNILLELYMFSRNICRDILTP